MPNEADTCRRYVVPRLQAAGWDNDPYRINEQVTFTDGRIIVAGRRGRRRPGKRADYILLLRYRPDFPIAVVEAKLYRIEPGDLVFNNVFAWEGAIAVAQPEDAGRFGSHRFITCVPRTGTATADFLCFYFLTPEGLEQIGEASPGGPAAIEHWALKNYLKSRFPFHPTINRLRSAV